MDQEVAPDDIQTQWQEARANRRMQFKVGDYKDSNIRMLTGTLKADWIQLPVKRYPAALPTLKQGAATGVFKIKGASSWAITRAEKLQVSVFPMTCHWMSGVQGSTPCPRCGLMCLCWEPAICAGWSAMIFTTYGRSMMSQHVGQYPPTMAITTAASGNQGAWLVPACRKRRAALYQQI